MLLWSVNLMLSDEVFGNIASRAGLAQSIMVTISRALFPGLIGYIGFFSIRLHAHAASLGGYNHAGVTCLYIIIWWVPQSDPIATLPRYLRYLTYFTIPTLYHQMPRPLLGCRVDPVAIELSINVRSC